MLEIIKDQRNENGWTNFASFIKLGKQGMINQKPTAYETHLWLRKDLLEKICFSYVDCVLDGLFKDTPDNRMDFCFGQTDQRMKGLSKSFNWIPFRGTLIVITHEIINKTFKRIL